MSQGKWLSLEQRILNIKTNGKGLIELTTYQGIALWWFIRFRLYHSAQSNPLAQLLIKKTNLFSIADFLYDFLSSILCRTLSMLFRVKVDKKGPKVLITSWRARDVYFDFIINELKKRNYNIVTVRPLKYSFSELKTVIGKLKSRKNIIHKQFNAYWSMKTWKKEYYANRYFRNLWKNISENDGKFVNSLKKYPLTSELPYYFNSMFGYVVKNIEMAKEVVEEEKPDLILLISEYGIFERALVVAGKLNKVPTLAIQHGSIGPVHKGYMYSKGSISASGSIETPYCPIPDKTAVYGKYDYDLLTKMSSYPISSVVIAGQPRYDILAAADSFFDREKFCKRLNLNPSRKIVLIATENIPISEGKAFLKRVLRALKNFPELQIVVKPHPLEKGEWYRKVVEEENASGVVVLSKYSDTFEALYACDLLVTGFSTVITEAIILGKAVVSMHLSRSEDPTPYYKEVTLRVYREEDLVPSIRKALYDEETKEKLKEAGRKFVYKHAYKQDGKATERVVNLIEEMVRKRIQDEN